MKASYDGVVLKADVSYETVQYWSVTIPPNVERELGLKPRDRFLVRIPGAFFRAECFGSPGDLAFQFPPEMARTLNLRGGAKLKIELEKPDGTATK